MTPGRRLRYQLFLFVNFIAGSTALILDVLPEMMGDSFSLEMISPVRGMLFGALAVFLLLLLAALIVIWIKPDWLTAFDAYVLRHLKRQNAAFDMLVGLASAVVFVLALTLLMLSLAPGEVGIVHLVLRRIRAVLFYLDFLSLSLLAAFLVLFGQALKKPDVRYAGSAPLMALMTLITFSHWVIFLLQIPVIVAIPNWFMQLKYKGGGRLVIFLPLLVLALLITWRILQRPKRLGFNLFLLGVLMLALVWGLAAVEGSPFEVLRSKHTDYLHQAYSEVSAQEEAWPDFIVDFETVWGSYHFLGTKPPGVLLPYIGLHRALDWLDPLPRYEDRLVRLDNALTLVFPMVMALGLIPLALIFRHDFEKGFLVFPLLLYALNPGLILGRLELDVVLYPLLLMGGVGIMRWVLKRFSFWGALLLGVYVYFSIFITFSLLPMLALIGLYLAFHFLSNLRQRIWWDYVKVGLGFLLGLALLGLIFYFALDYDPFLRYQNAITIHRESKAFGGGLRKVLNAMLVNNLEFGQTIGLALFLLTLVRVGMGVRALFRRAANRLDLLAAAFGGMFLLLNFAGQTIGEVSRLWMFQLPVMVALAADALLKLYQRKKAVIVWLVVLSWGTLMVIFTYQDYF